jgi:hypothetical protein
MNDDDLMLILAKYERGVGDKTIDQSSRVIGLCRTVREQNKRARHAEQERGAFDRRIAELEVEVAKLKPEAEAWHKGHEVIRELRERVIPCGHKIEDLIGGEGSVTKCGACLAAKQAERATFAGSKP